MKEVPAELVEYRDASIMAGLVEDMPPEDVFLKFRGERVGEPLTLYMRKDEAQAVLFVLSAALWALEVQS